MKTKIIATLALAAAATGLVSTARADHSRFSVSIGVASGPAYCAPAECAPAPVYVPAPDDCAPTTTVVTAPGYGYGYSNYNNYGSAAPCGHWENVTRRVWVPERWVASCDHWGRPVRILERGYFTFRTERVWVADNYRRGGYSDGGYGYGYGYRG